MRKTEEDQGAKAVRYMVSVIMGGICALVVCLLFLLAVSACISKGLLDMGLIYQLTLVGCVLGSFAGGRMAVRRCGARALIVGLCAGLVLFLLLLTIGVIGFHAAPESGGIGLLCASLCGGAVAGLLGGGQSQGKKKRRK